MLTNRQSMIRRGTILSGLIISVSIAAGMQKAEARQQRTQESRQNYRIVGELGENDILALWPPARRQAVSSEPSREGRRFYRVYRSGSKIPLGDWAPDSGMAVPDGRLTADENRLRVQRNSRDRDGDGVPDNRDHHPVDRNRGNW